MKRALKTLSGLDDGARLVEKLLVLSESETVCLLDSCGVAHLDSRFLIAGVKPVEMLELFGETPEDSLRLLDEAFRQTDLFGIFTISYDFGLRLEKIKPRAKEMSGGAEPDVFLALFDALVVHDYQSRQTFLIGNEKSFGKIEKLLERDFIFPDPPPIEKTEVRSNFTKAEYLETIEEIKELIRRGDTYQTNLTQQLRARLPENLTPQTIFQRLRKNHPAPFAAFLKRKDSYVISASPERFFRIEAANRKPKSRTISASPIKGTRPRGRNRREDDKFRRELLTSEKDRAENVMIVDLLRNDLGRICEYGSVRVPQICEIEEHPTLFHLVSTVTGVLRPQIAFSDILRAVFPCGSITGAPKIRTMQIIDGLETAPRGLSMGAVGYLMPEQPFAKENAGNFRLKTGICDLSVAIRTMVVSGGEAIFNVGGGIVIDSFPESEYEETLTKAKALLQALDGRLFF